VKRVSVKAHTRKAPKKRAQRKAKKRGAQLGLFS